MDPARRHGDEVDEATEHDFHGFSLCEGVAGDDVAGDEVGKVDE